ncbi:substrate binding domain-containing protein [Pseudoduganella flava]|nr:substrate binding domain-containing protein [Pseudoduganella flava]
MARFSGMYPGVQVELVLSDAQVDVTAGEADVALSVGLPPNPLVVARRFAEGRRVVCASPPYLARHGMPQVPEDLADHDCLRLVRGRRRVDRWSFQRDGDVFEVPVSGRLVATSSEVMCQWALDGHGIGLKGLWDIRNELDEGRLVECLRSLACDDVDLYLVYMRRPHLPPRKRVFVDFLM